MGVGWGKKYHCCFFVFGRVPTILNAWSPHKIQQHLPYIPHYPHRAKAIVRKNKYHCLFLFRRVPIIINAWSPHKIRSSKKRKNREPHLAHQAVKIQSRSKWPLEPAPSHRGARNGCSSTPRSRRGARNDCSSPPRSRRWLEMAIRSRWSASPNLRYIANVRLPTDWKCSVWTFIFPSFLTHHLVERTLQKCTCLKMLTRGSTRPCLHHFVQK